MKRGTIADERPDLLEEWVFEKNSISPYEVTCGSDKRAWWVCKVCSKEWDAEIYRRASKNNPRGCPRCALKYRAITRAYTASKKNNLLEKLPELCKEWNYEKNFPLRPEDVSFGSHKKVGWKCRKCGHCWPSTIRNRANGNGCPACSGRVVTDLNRLSVTYPKIAAEWGYDKNYPISPEDVSYACNKKYWWKCYLGHTWEIGVSTRTSVYLKSGCPYCSGYFISDANRISVQYPEVAKQWHSIKNGGRTPENTSYAAHYRAWWLCDAGHETQAFVVNRTSLGHKCVVCANIPRSKISQQWLDSMGVPDEHGVTREVVLKFDGGYFKVDGFDPATNTIYEFFGDYWHGNPCVFPSREKNAHNGKTFGELFDKTIDKLNKLKSLHYTVVSVWESDFIRECELC